jgi:putative transposase
MSRKGNYWGNSVDKSIFKSLKTEWVFKNKYLRKIDVEMSLFK